MMWKRQQLVQRRSGLVQNEANTVVEKAVPAIANISGRRQRCTTCVPYTAIQNYHVSVFSYSCWSMDMYHVYHTQQYKHITYHVTTQSHLHLKFDVVYRHITLYTGTWGLIPAHHAVYRHITLYTGTSRCIPSHRAVYRHITPYTGTSRCIPAHHGSCPFLFTNNLCSPSPCLRHPQGVLSAFVTH